MFSLAQIESNIKSGLNASLKASLGMVKDANPYIGLCAKQLYPFINIIRQGSFVVRLDGNVKVITIPYIIYIGIKSISDEELSLLLSMLVNGFLGLEEVGQPMKIQESNKVDDCAKDYREIKIALSYNYKC